MAEPFLSEIRMTSFNFAPKGWALCNGALLPINQYQALFSLLGTTFGGDGRVNFALPNLMGRTPIHAGSGHTLGEMGGEQSHTLSAAETAHTHPVARGNADSRRPQASKVPGVAPTNLYRPGGGSNPVDMYSDANTVAVASVGGSQAHQNMQPFLTLNFAIALQGIFPSPN